MSKQRDHAGRQALEQAVSWGFRFLFIGVGLLALGWIKSGFVVIESGNRAVVMRFGEVVRISESGLVWSWPRPIDTVIIVPGTERQLTQTVTALDLNLETNNTETSTTNTETTTKDTEAAALLQAQEIPLDQRKNGYALSGDGGVVQVSGTVFYQVTDAAAYVLAQERLSQVLERTFLSSAIAAVATRQLDGVVVVNANAATDNGQNSAANMREQLRGDIRSAMNNRLQFLDVGIAISRIDLITNLPARARPAFDQVLAAEAEAARILASARTDAETYRQQGERDSTEIKQDAEAKANELRAQATVATAGILALSAERSPQQRSLLLTRLYRERLEGILRRAGLVSVVDGREPVRLILPGGSEVK